MRFEMYSEIAILASVSGIAWVLYHLCDHYDIQLSSTIISKTSPTYYITVYFIDLIFTFY